MSQATGNDLDEIVEMVDLHPQLPSDPRPMRDEYVQTVEVVEPEGVKCITAYALISFGVTALCVVYLMFAKCVDVWPFVDCADIDINETE